MKEIARTKKIKEITRDNIFKKFRVDLVCFYWSHSMYNHPSHVTITSYILVMKIYGIELESRRLKKTPSKILKKS